MASERQIRVGGVAIGGGAPVVVQSMTLTKTHDVEATTGQIAALASAGCEIVRVSQAALKVGFNYYLQIVGLVSMSLALLNLLPFLPLDGGHILFSVIERIRRRAVAREVYERVSAVGIALVLMLFFIGLSNDVGRIGGG